MPRKRSQPEPPVTDDTTPRTASYLGENIVVDVISQPKGKADNARISAKAKQEIEQTIAMQQQRDRSMLLRFMLGSWKTTKEHETKLRGTVAWIIFSLLGVELVAGNVAFFFFGFGLIDLPIWVAETFYVGMYVQIIGIVTIVVKSLFPDSTSDTLTEMNKMLDKL